MHNNNNVSILGNISESLIRSSFKYEEDYIKKIKRSSYGKYSYRSIRA